LPSSFSAKPRFAGLNPSRLTPKYLNAALVEQRGNAVARALV
jgi:hypothetical protein